MGGRSHTLKMGRKEVPKKWERMSRVHASNAALCRGKEVISKSKGEKMLKKCRKGTGNNRDKKELGGTV